MPNIRLTVVLVFLFTLSACSNNVNSGGSLSEDKIYHISGYEEKVQPLSRVTEKIWGYEVDENRIAFIRNPIRENSKSYESVFELVVLDIENNEEQVILRSGPSSVPGDEVMDPKVLGFEDGLLVYAVYEATEYSDEPMDILNWEWNQNGRFIFHNLDTGEITDYPWDDIDYFPSNEILDVGGGSIVWHYYEKGRTDEDGMIWSGDHTYAFLDGSTLELSFFPDAYWEELMTNGKQMFWGFERVKMHNMETGETFAITPEGMNEDLLHVKKDKLIIRRKAVKGVDGAQGNSLSLYSYDLNAKEYTLLTDGRFEVLSGDADGDYIVWSQYWEIYYKKIGRDTVRVTDNNVDDRNPIISGKNIVWEQEGKLMLYIIP